MTPEEYAILEDYKKTVGPLTKAALGQKSGKLHWFTLTGGGTRCRSLCGQHAELPNRHYFDNNTPCCQTCVSAAKKAIREERGV